MIFSFYFLIYFSVMCMSSSNILFYLLCFNLHLISISINRYIWMCIQFKLFESYYWNEISRKKKMSLQQLQSDSISVIIDKANATSRFSNKIYLIKNGKKNFFFSYTLNSLINKGFETQVLFFFFFYCFII